MREKRHTEEMAGQVCMGRREFWTWEREKKGCLEEQSRWRRRTSYSEMGQTGRVTSS